MQLFNINSKSFRKNLYSIWFRSKFQVNCEVEFEKNYIISLIFIGNKAKFHPIHNNKKNCCRNSIQELYVVLIRFQWLYNFQNVDSKKRILCQRKTCIAFSNSKFSPKMYVILSKNQREYFFCRNFYCFQQWNHDIFLIVAMRRAEHKKLK